MIDWYEHHVLGEDINLDGMNLGKCESKMRICTFLVHFASLPLSYPSLVNFVQKNVLK